MPLTRPITGWHRAQAMTAEGLCLLWWLVPGALQLMWLWQGLPLPHSLLLPLGAAAVQGLLLSPWRLSRLAYYCRMGEQPFSLAPLATGWRHWGAAVAWRWHLWWRRSAVGLAAVAPAFLLWHYGAQVDTPILWLPLGAAALLLTLPAAGAFLCRYAAAPVLILKGYPAGAAISLSTRVMRGHIREYINFYGAHLWRLGLSLTLFPAPWVLPRFGITRAALLLAWCEEELTIKN